MSVSSDPNRWLLSFYATLRSHPAFATFAPSIQFELLAHAVEREHPSKGAAMREWSVAAQHGMLRHLALMHDQHESGAPVELWGVRKQDRTLACVAVYMMHGIDVRLMEGNNFRRTQLCKDALEVETLAHKWRTALWLVGPPLINRSAAVRVFVSLDCPRECPRSRVKRRNSAHSP